MRISITDQIADDLQAGLKPGQAVEDEVQRRLLMCEHVKGREPLIVLNTHEMDAIAERIGTGLPIRSKADLLRAIDQTAQLKMGDCRLVFTPGMLKQIEERAGKIGETPERFVGRVASKLITDVFLVEPGPEGVFYTPGFDPTDDVDDLDNPEPPDLNGSIE